jgi:hypothetical protein
MAGADDGIPTNYVAPPRFRPVSANPNAAQRDVVRDLGFLAGLDSSFTAPDSNGEQQQQHDGDNGGGDTSAPARPAPKRSRGRGRGVHAPPVQSHLSASQEQPILERVAERITSRGSNAQQQQQKGNLKERSVTFAPSFEDLVESIMASREATRAQTAAEAKRARTLEAAKIAAKIIEEEDDDNDDNDEQEEEEVMAVAKKGKRKRQEVEQEEDEEEEEEAPQPRKQVKRLPVQVVEEEQEEEEEEDATPSKPVKRSKSSKPSAAVAAKPTPKKILTFIERVQAHQAAGSGLRKEYEAPEHQYLQHNYPTFYRNAFRSRR